MRTKPMKFEDYVSEMCLRKHIPDCKPSTLKRNDTRARWVKAKHVFNDILLNGPFDPMHGGKCKWTDGELGDIREPIDAFYVWWDI